MPATIGRIVHYRLPDTANKSPRWRPAIITNVFGSCVNLQIFLDGNNDSDLFLAGSNGPLQAMAYSRSEGTEVGEWRWPPRE